jgi:hypothetical protein
MMYVCTCMEEVSYHRERVFIHVYIIYIYALYIFIYSLLIPFLLCVVVATILFSSIYTLSFIYIDGMNPPPSCMSHRLII